MSGLTEQMRVIARELLAAGQVDYVIGYETGTDGVNARPYFAYSQDDTERLIFDQTCTHNLINYLPEPERRGKNIGVAVKACDARALNVLVGEKQFPRARITAIGVVCPGIVQRTREGGDGVTLQEKCQVCAQHTPVTYDRLAGEPIEEPVVANPFGLVEQFALRDAADRQAFWAEQFDRCIRCYACRQACPQCYCTDCFAEMLDPEWVGIRIGAQEKWMFHTIRAYHLAGRCVGCDECQRVCPVHIPLGLLNGTLRKQVVEVFDFQAGLDPDQPAPLQTFKKDEKLGAG